jgi:hypothetical protein
MIFKKLFKRSEDLKPVSGAKFYEGISLIEILQGCYHVKHSILIDISKTKNVIYIKSIQAYHISSIEWDVIVRSVNFNNGKQDDDKFETRTFLNPSQITVKRCSTDSKESVEGNCFSDFDVMSNSMAEVAYVFWVEDLEQYGVVYHSYFNKSY